MIEVNFDPDGSDMHQQTTQVVIAKSTLIGGMTLIKA